MTNTSRSAGGIFITLYGVNNVGKTTQAKLLLKRLQDEGHKALYLKYPLYDLEPTGPQLNQILRQGKGQNISEEALQTLFTQNRLDFEPELKKLLSEGTIIVAEDYTGTGIAWGTAKGLDFSWIKTLNKDLLEEDFALLLEGNRYLDSIEKGHIHEENPELSARVGEILNKLAQDKGWTKIQVKGIEDTAEDIWKVVREFLEKRGIRSV